MKPDRIAELLAPFLGDAAQQQVKTTDLDRISTYIDILLRWNARVNLTAIREPEEIVTRHFGESLFAARVLFPDRYVGTATPGCPAEPSSAHGRERTSEISPRESLADIGSGAGFPGFPIKLWRPSLSLTLIESNHRKAVFLREIARALTLTDINIIATRAQSLTAGGFHTVTLRAVERFESILPVAASLVVPGGRLAVMVGSGQASAAQAILEKLATFNLLAAQTHTIPHSRSRVLMVVERSR